MTPDTHSEKVAPAKKATQLPANLPLEFIPLYDWWKTNGTQFMIQAGIAVLVVGAVLGGKFYYHNQIASANKELLKASTTEELEALVQNYGTWKIGNTARLRLAKSYYDAGKYDEALAAYDACISKGAPAGFADVAVLGRAVCLEAMIDRQGDAFEAYSTFIKDHPTHFLVMQARMGQARALALQGKKDKAKEALETLKAEKTGDPVAEMAIAQLQGVIARYEPRQAVSSLDTSMAPGTVPATAPAQTERK